MGKVHRDVVEDIRGEECKGQYCLLIEILLKDPSLSDRILEQTKCIEKFKWERSKKLGEEVDWREAHEGYAKRFAETYKEGLLNGDIYEIVMGRKEPSGVRPLFE